MDDLIVIVTKCYCLRSDKILIQIRVHIAHPYIWPLGAQWWFWHHSPVAHTPTHTPPHTLCCWQADGCTPRGHLNGYICTAVFQYNVFQIGFLTEQSPWPFTQSRYNADPLPPGDNTHLLTRARDQLYNKITSSYQGPLWTRQIKKRNRHLSSRHALSPAKMLPLLQATEFLSLFVCLVVMTFSTGVRIMNNYP